MTNLSLEKGTAFAGYRVESLIGRGGMGVVYRATDLSLDRPVALKLIAPELAQDERFRRRFLRESRVAAALDHPNVIPIYEAGEHDGQLYLAMRYVRGSDLSTALAAARRLAPERTVKVLGQVAGALDAAHRRGIVHRDVKPANVLLDEDGHPYLTDFGITKQTGGASTDTGRMVGTLDYVAPEQIRGEPVDARTDEYALACVVYECLSGKPPFRRETEAETLWAHMQEEPPALRRHPALVPVMRRALAKQKEERYETCGDFVRAAADALGVAAPSIRQSVAGSLVRRRHAIIAAGLIALVGAVVAAVLALTGGREGADLGASGTGIAAIDAGGDVAEFIETGPSPGNIAVGEGAVWMLDGEIKTISRIDPETKAVTGRLETRDVPTDVAAGEGWLWVGTGGGSFGNFTTKVSQVDPKSLKVRRTVKLPDRTGVGARGSLSWGFPNIVVGDGAVWTRNPDSTISRLDSETGTVVATLDVEANTLAAGDAGVWFTSGGGVSKINPRTNRVATRVRIGSGSEDPSGIAVGGGAVWVSAERHGVVWRIDPGPPPQARTIDVAPGVTYAAYGDGALWAASYVDGTVARIDPATNSVTARTPIGAPQTLAAGEGGAWVSTAGAPEPGTLPDHACEELVAGVPDPDVLIASDLPLQGPTGAAPRAMADAIRFVLREHGFTAGEHSVGYRSCDESTAQAGAFDLRRCAANANAYAEADRLVAIIGPWSSYCAEIQIPALNRAESGPLAMISPTNTEPGLTRAYRFSDPGTFPDAPDVYYPTGIRNYMRLRPADDLQGAAHAVLARDLELRSVYVLYDPESFWRGLVAHPFTRAAAKLDVRVAGNRAYDPRAESYRDVVDQVAESGAEGVVIGGDPYAGGNRLVQALRARLGDRITIMGSFLFAFAPEVLDFVGPAARGMYATSVDVPLTELPLTPAAESFVRRAGLTGTPDPGVLEIAQATELVLDAISRSDGTRASVLEELRSSEERNGLVGTFHFDRNGDITPSSIPILRIVGKTAPKNGLQREFEGAVVDRVVNVPPALIE